MNYQPVSTFSQIYDKALRNHLKRIGNSLNMLRTTRREDITTVSAATNLTHEILEKIENGEHDFQVNNLSALCEYYDIDYVSIVGDGELLHVIISNA